MSRLCRLKTKLHGEDGQWAYQEITTLRAKVAELEAKLEKYQNLEPVAWHHPVEGLSYENHYTGNIPLYALEK